MLNKNIYPYWSAAALSTSSPAYKDPVQGCGYVPASLQLLMLAAWGPVKAPAKAAGCQNICISTAN